MFRQNELDVMVREIAERETKPVIDKSIEKIADEIEKRVGSRPSKSVIWASLHRIGAQASGRKFIYRHTGTRHE